MCERTRKLMSSNALFSASASSLDKVCSMLCFRGFVGRSGVCVCGVAAGGLGPASRLPLLTCFPETFVPPESSKRWRSGGLGGCGGLGDAEDESITMFRALQKEP